VGGHVLSGHIKHTSNMAEWFNAQLNDVAAPRVLWASELGLTSHQTRERRDR